MNAESIIPTSRLWSEFALAALLLASAPVRAGEADLLAGKWSVKKANEEGQNYTQTIEIKKDKFIFEILSANADVLIHAEGDLKLEKLGPFNSARFFHIRGGASTADLQEVDDEYVSIYTLDEDTWTVASNLDRQRAQKPSLDVYQRVKPAAKTATLIIDEIEMAETPQSGTWYFCFEAKVEGVSRRFNVENKGYERNRVRIPLAVELPKVSAGQQCRFSVRLDDVPADACTDEADNRSTGEFTVSERGSQAYRPEDHWRYTLRWHLK